MKRHVLAWLVSLTLTFSCTSAWAVDASALVGRWNITLTMKNNLPKPSWLELSIKDGKLQGRFVGMWGGVYTLKDIPFENNTLTLNTFHGKYTGKYADGKFSGELVGDPSDPRTNGTFKWVATKYAYRPDINGTWDGTTASGEKIQLTLQQTDKAIAGTLKAGEQSSPVENVALKQQVLTFTARGSKYSARVRGDRLEGTVAGGDKDAKESKWTATRNREWGEPIQLFNGKDLNGWRPLDGEGPGNWKVENNVLVNAHPGPNIRTADTFKDFKLHIEFNAPRGGNSGVYLRGRYEVQVHDSYGEKLSPSMCGAIYGRHIPPINACKPSGEWQTYDITLTGPYVTIVQNGKVIADNVEIDGITGGAIDSNEDQPGPIYLQGDHTAMQFRNITLSPAKTPEKKQ